VTTPEPVRVGVVGVGSMGHHHARVYDELPEADLVGVADLDTERAREEAEARDTEALSPEELFERTDAVSVVVPTGHHATVAGKALDGDVNVLVEKPFVDDVENGRQLIQRAADRGLVLQVGHVERFNPAVDVLSDVLQGTEIVAIDAQRLGPPLDREMDNGVVLDLMIHDIDVIQSLVDAEVAAVSATRADGHPHVDASLTFDDGTIASLTASRISQQRTRRLAVTTPQSLVDVDYLTRSAEIHRRSLPEYVETDGKLRYRNESVIERPVVSNGEPLKAELESFIDAVRTGEQPAVTGEDGIEALQVARRIDERASTEASASPEVSAE